MARGNVDKYGDSGKACRCNRKSDARSQQSNSAIAELWTTDICSKPLLLNAKPAISASDGDGVRRPNVVRRTISWAGENKLDTISKTSTDFKACHKRFSSVGRLQLLVRSQDLMSHQYCYSNNMNHQPPSECAPDAQNSPALIIGLECNEEDDGSDEQKMRLRAKEEKVQKLRWRNMKSRADCAEMRRILKDLRQRISQADEGLIKLAREEHVRGFDRLQDNTLKLQEQYRQMQAARDEYGPFEESYNALEERLDREEWELRHLEKQVLRGGGGDDCSDSGMSEPDSSMHMVDENQEAALELDDNNQFDLHKQYRSRLGDADLACERLAHLRVEYGRHRDLQDLMERVGMELSPEAQAALVDLPTEEAVLTEQLQIINEDIKRLRMECVRDGLFGDERSDSELIGEEGIEDTISLEGSNGSTMPVYNRSQLLETLPSLDINDITEIQDDKGTKDKMTKNEQVSNSVVLNAGSEDMDSRISQWLLQKLRSSRLEVELLERISADSGLDLPTHGDKWVELVVEFWFVDSTVKLSPSAYLAETVTTIDSYGIPPSPFADRNSPSLSNSQGAHFVQLMIYSSPASKRLDFAPWLGLKVPKGKRATTGSLGSQ
jgi:hypothetical protein